MRSNPDLVTEYTPELAERVRTARSVGYGWDAIRRGCGVSRATAEKWCAGIQVTPRHRGPSGPSFAAGPLRALIKQRGLRETAVEQAVGIADVRWSRGYVSAITADKICVHLGLHPAEVYGNEWWDAVPPWRDDEDRVA